MNRRKSVFKVLGKWVIGSFAQGRVYYDAKDTFPSRESAETELSKRRSPR